MGGEGAASGQRLRRRGGGPAAAAAAAKALGSRMQGEAEGPGRPGARPQQLPEPGQGPQQSSCQPLGVEGGALAQVGASAPPPREREGRGREE